VIMILYLVL